MLATAHSFCNVSIDQNSMMNTKEVRECLKKIKLIDEVVITKPDKVSGVVVLNKDEYINKMLKNLNDKSKFKCLGPVNNSYAETMKLEKKICKLLKDLVSSKELSQEVFDLIKPTGSVSPRLYGLPKLHKEGIPFRPIISMIKSPQHGLAEYLNSLLEPVVQYILFKLYSQRLFYFCK